MLFGTLLAGSLNQKGSLIKKIKSNNSNPSHIEEGFLFQLLFIVKMKYIISESQYNLLSESSTLLWVKRRVTYENMKNYISDGEINFPTLCDDFGDEFEYADSVIKWAVDDFLTSNEDAFLDEIYDEVHEIVVDKCKDWFGEYLLNIYRDTCTEEDEYGLY